MSDVLLIANSPASRPLFTSSGGLVGNLQFCFGLLGVTAVPIQVMKTNNTPPPHTHTAFCSIMVFN